MRFPQARARQAAGPPFRTPAVGKGVTGFPRMNPPLGLFRCSRWAAATGVLRRLPALMAIVVAGVAAGAASGGGPAGIPPLHGARAPQAVRAAGTATRVPALEEQVLAALNDVRREHGLGPLRLNRS